jgi:hypothetical protein
MGFGIRHLAAVIPILGAAHVPRHAITAPPIFAVASRAQMIKMGCRLS